MRNFLYKLVFPISNKLYFGRASNSRRYGPVNKPGQRFFGPHHNPEVQCLLDSGEPCFFLVVVSGLDPEDLKTAEDTYLKRVWSTGCWDQRPWWLLNRTNNSVGASTGSANPVHLLTYEQKVENVKWMQTPEVRARRDESYRETLSKLETHWNKGRKRPDQAERNKTPEKRAALRRSALRVYPCPHCGRKMNPGNLTQHIKRKH